MNDQLHPLIKDICDSFVVNLDREQDEVETEACNKYHRRVDDEICERKIQ